MKTLRWLLLLAFAACAVEARADDGGGCFEAAVVCGSAADCCSGACSAGVCVPVACDGGLCDTTNGSGTDGCSATGSRPSSMALGLMLCFGVVLAARWWRMRPRSSR